ncbi:PREDICTED: ATP-binding cassette sub-family A member 3-like [Amphimedon queenslandica]|nr:PREDICTED: ATP-binding cassette sub-family A member 3-like [Amphimedon queenslandica]|eukprot:XP_019857855.1 PREDICTED: ATP-binding cassette sub-family A member 3-like [Amphimedon queenslandica]
MKPSGRCWKSCSLLTQQYFLLLWKNFILQFRRPIGTVFEIVLPLLAVIFLVGLRLGLFKGDDICFRTFDTTRLTDNDQNDYYRNKIYYAPNSSEANELAQVFFAPMIGKTSNEVVGFPTEDDFIRSIKNESEGYGCFSRIIGIYFESLSNDTKYSIRFPNCNDEWNTNSVSNQFDTGGGAITDNYYLITGFMQVEKVMNEAIVKWKTGEYVDDTYDTVNIRQFPYPQYRQDFFLDFVNVVLPLFMILTFLYSAGVFVKELVLEKESRIRETMKMMGLSNWILWTTWFTKQLLFYFVPLVIMTILLKYGRIFAMSNVFLIFLFLFFFLVSGIAFCFFVSVWFNSARIGLLAGFILWFVSFFPYLILGPLYSTLNFGTKIGTCFLSNTCVGYGVYVLTTLEVRLEGLSFENFARPLSIVDSFNMGWVIFMMIVDTVLYMVLYWYIDAVKPGRYGVPKPLYFPFLPSYWCGYRRSKPLSEEELAALSQATDDPTAHEEEPVDLPVGISIDKLTKVFDRMSLKKRKLAVDHLTLKMFKGQITALLGHNGAGKTTTMSILTGLYPPTEGRAAINGLDVVNDIDLIRYNLGICPQHNVLFDRLTVSEHLSFFARLKGCPGHRVKQEVPAMIADLNLVDKTKTQSKKLSGGMKRKLSVGIALVGGSEVVILDEPTSGMDPYARRATWDLLIRHKEGRTILLTTHFMDEADLLGDRIAIMAEGKLKCSGSSLFLKTRYGVGYHLTVVKDPSCNVDNVVSLVERMVTGAAVSTNIGSELSFTLPSQSSHLFAQLFDSFENQKDALGISSFGVSLTTMEEVFMRVSTGYDNTLLNSKAQSVPSGPVGAAIPPKSDAEDETDLSVNLNEEEGVAVKNPRTRKQSGRRYSTLAEADEEGYGTMMSQSNSVLNTGLLLWVQQFAAMFLKRFYHSIRFWQAVIWQLVIPLIFVLFGLIVAKVVPKVATRATSPSRVLSIDNSAPSNNVSLFWASFDPSLSFTDSEVAFLGSTNFFDFTDSVSSINDSVETISDTSSCCQYKYQILDKYCASRSTSDLRSTCGNSDNFGYKPCLNCLGCCYGISDYYYCDNYGTAISGCPLNPSISVNDHDDLSGPVDSVNVFVAEKLLQLSEEVKLYNFFLIYQAGYVVHAPEPVYSTCGNFDNEDNTCAYLNYALKEENSCSSDDPNLNCFQLDNSYWNYSYSSSKDSCQSESCSLSSSSICSCSSTQDNTCQMSRISQPSPPDTKPTVTIWYNNQAYHMAAAALNGFYNLYLKSKNSGVSITVTNDPLPKDLNDDDDFVNTADFGFGLMISILSMFGLSFLYSSFIVFPIQEKQSKAKHLQFVSGVNASSYWLGTYVWDLINAYIPAIIIIILFAAFNVEGFEKENLAAVFGLVMLSCWACIPVNYSFSFIFSNPLVGFCIMLCLYFFLPLIFQITVLALTFSYPKTAKVLNYIFLVHPGFSLMSGLNLAYNNQLNKYNCEKDEYCDSYIKDIFQFSYPGIGHIFLYMIIEGIIFLVLSVLIERHFFIPDLKQMLGHKSTSSSLPLPNEDNDVAEERRRINDSEYSAEGEAVIIKNLVKVYKDIPATICPCTPSCQHGCKLAVSDVNLIIPTGECFGLLGVNGAGKTTTFKILTGDITPTSGTAVLSGYDISTQLHSVQQRIGYCPQFDALIERLTGREFLTMFARLRGIREKAIKGVVQSVIDRLDLSKYADKRCGTYSGGNKRKLSTAVALVGDPPIVLLDEPTTGMDPATRRYLWNVLIEVIRNGRSVILTSHSMEECEALCTRLAIMVNGRFKCLGSIQHLKSKFGHGYTLQIKVRPLPPQEGGGPGVRPGASPYDTGQIQHFVGSVFPGSLLLEQHQGSVTYQVPSEGITWSRIFSTVEHYKESLNIADYSVCQTTLEQVFINFAQEQYVED